LISASTRRVGQRQKLTQAERASLSLSRMLDAAAELIIEKGTHSTTLKEISERAGYSRAMAGARFGSKEAVFAELIDVFSQQWKLKLRDFVGENTGLQAFSCAIDCVIYFMEENTSNFRAMYVLFFESIGTSEVMRRRLADQHAVYRHDTEKWIRQAIDQHLVRPDIVAPDIAFEYMAFYFGTIYQWLANPEKINYRVALHRFRTKLFSQIKS